MVFVASLLLAISLSASFLNSALGAVAVAVLAGLFLQFNKERTCDTKTLAAGMVCIVCMGACAWNATTSQRAGAAEIPAPSTLPADEETLPPHKGNPPSASVVDLPKPANNHEIRTAVSFNTPGQIEAQGAGAEVFYPTLTEEDGQILFPQRRSFRSETDGPGEYAIKLECFLREYIQGFLHTTPNCEDSLLNGNAELGRYIQESHEIDKAIKTGRSVALYERLIAVYEKANALGLKSSVISLQLARPYAEIIEIYPRDTPEACEQIFRYGSQGIRFYIKTMEYESVRGTKTGDILYRIGQIYHYMADVPNLDHSLRTELYQISSAYLDLAAEDSILN